MKTSNWDSYFMGLAKQVAQNSKCFSRKLGAILVRDKHIISTGYNGPPKKIPHCDTRGDGGCPRKKQGYASGEGLDLCIAGHAERNAIISAARVGISTAGSTLYCYCGPPCKDCMIEIINAGIVEVVYKNSGGTGNFGEYYDLLSEYLVENSSIVVRGIDFD